MTRKYESTRRSEAAAQTRRQILQAALKLHQEGITQYGPLAEQAGCSEATVRKHFPTRESLFQSCTRAFAENFDHPDLDAIAAIEDSGRRIRSAVSELCRVHEAMLGYAWLSARLRDESAVLDSEMQAYEGLADAVAGIVSSGEPDPVVRSLLDFLSYRAFRKSGNLSPEAARDELTRSVRAALARSTSNQEPSKP